MTKLLFSIFLSSAVIMGQTLAFAKPVNPVKVSEKMKKKITEIPAQLRHYDGDKKEALLQYFDRLAQVEIKKSVEFKRLSKINQEQILAFNNSINQLAKEYSAALRADTSLDPVMVADAFLNEFEQAYFVFYIFVGAGGAVFLALIWLSAVLDGICWGLYC